jgi:hypothetical protein
MKRSYVLFFSAVVLLFSSFPAGAQQWGGHFFLPPGPNPPNAAVYGSTAFRTFYPPSVLEQTESEHGVLIYPFGFYHYYSPCYLPEEPKPEYYQGVKTAGEIRIAVTPPEAQVLVDGIELTEKDTEFYTMGLLTGIHAVEIRAPGYRPYREDVEIQTAATKTLHITLEAK